LVGVNPTEIVQIITGLPSSDYVYRMFGVNTNNLTLVLMKRKQPWLQAEKIY